MLLLKDTKALGKLGNIVAETSSSSMFRHVSQGVNKNTCGSGSRPSLFFSAGRPYYFFKAIDRATLFSPGGCGLLPKWRLLSH
jgi:hypothetical protein